MQVLFTKLIVSWENPRSTRSDDKINYIWRNLNDFGIIWVLVVFQNGRLYAGFLHELNRILSYHKLKRKRKFLWSTLKWKQSRDRDIFSHKVLFKRTVVCFRKGFNTPVVWFLSGFIRRLSWWSLHQWKQIDWLSGRENKRMLVISTGSMVLGPLWNNK